MTRGGLDRFEALRAMLVFSDTAKMLTDNCSSVHFKVDGEGYRHLRGVDYVRTSTAGVVTTEYSK